VDWNAIRAEYIGGGISQRKLAEKHGVSIGTLLRRANQEHWLESRTKADNKAILLLEQKTANAASDNAAIAQRIKAKLLKRLEKEIDALPEKIGSETTGTNITNGKNDKGNKTRSITSQTYKLRDLTAAYKDLTDDMNLNANTEPVRIVIDV
jgi:hypothetical protein